MEVLRACALDTDGDGRVAVGEAAEAMANWNFGVGDAVDADPSDHGSREKFLRDAARHVAGYPADTVAPDTLRERSAGSESVADSDTGVDDRTRTRRLPVLPRWQLAGVFLGWTVTLGALQALQAGFRRAVEYIRSRV